MKEWFFIGIKPLAKADNQLPLFHMVDSHIQRALKQMRTLLPWLCDMILTYPVKRSM